MESVAVPRKIMMMVRAGSAVDELMEQLFPLLSPGDILIDGGNSNYEDTNRRVALAESFRNNALPLPPFLEIV